MRWGEILSCYTEWYIVRTCELLIFKIFHLQFSDWGWPQATETVESKIMAKVWGSTFCIWDMIQDSKGKMRRISTHGISIYSSTDRGNYHCVCVYTCVCARMHMHAHPLLGWLEFKCIFWDSLMWARWFIKSKQIFDFVCHKSEQACVWNSIRFGKRWVNRNRVIWYSCSDYLNWYPITFCDI